MDNLLEKKQDNLKKQKATRKKIFGVLILIEGIAFFMHTIIESNFNMHIGELYLDLSASKILLSLTKKHHIISFGIFTILWLNLLSYRKNKYQYIFWIIFLFSAIVEVTQIFFTEGHCRLSDLFPNLVGIIFSLAFYKLLEKWFKKAAFWYQFLTLNLYLAMSLIVFTFAFSYIIKVLIAP